MEVFFKNGNEKFKTMDQLEDPRYSVEYTDVKEFTEDFVDLEVWGFKERVFNVRTLTKVFKGFEPYDYYYYSNNSRYSDFFPSTILSFTDPEFDSKTKTVKYFENLSKREKGVKTESKIGKYLRKIGPWYNDKQIELLVDFFITENTVTDYKYMKGENPEDFEKVYRKKAESGRYLNSYKCLNSSCMRYEFQDLKHHPAYVYGTEDFSIRYLLNENGYSAGRVIVCHKTKEFGPIYASSEVAGDCLKEQVKLEFPCYGYTDEPDFDGAKLLAVKLGLIEYLAPYLDCYPSCNLEDDYFIIGKGNTSFSSLRGYVHTFETCYNCGDSVEDVITFDGRSYCDCCTHYCEYYREITLEDCHEVRISKYITQYWCESAIEDNAVWNEDLFTYVSNEYNEQLEKEKEEEEQNETV